MRVAARGISRYEMPLRSKAQLTAGQVLDPEGPPEDFRAEPALGADAGGEATRFQTMNLVPYTQPAVLYFRRTPSHYRRTPSHCLLLLHLWSQCC